MSLPGNGIFVVQGEMAMLVTAMRRSTRWGSHSFPNEEHDVLMRTFQDLKTILNQVDDLRLLDPATYLSPFLEVIRSKETTGPVTSLALSAIHKFLSYGLIDPTHPSVPATAEDIAEAVTHARFVGTDHSSDGVVLMKILQVLRTLMLSPEGVMLTDESVCEIMLSCFRICFETRLTELLRRNAEQCLRDMTQLVFMRLPQFTDELGANFTTMGLSLKKRDKVGKKKNINSGTNSLERRSAASPTTVGSDTEHDVKVDSLRHGQDQNLLNEAEITIEPTIEPITSPVKKHGRHSSMDLAGNNGMTELLEKCVNPDKNTDDKEKESEIPPTPDRPSSLEDPTEPNQEPPADAPSTQAPEADETIDKVTIDNKLDEYINDRGIRFTQQEEVVNLQPYGLTCVRELFRFLISLCNPLDAQNTSAMVHLGLCLVGTALEIGADQIAKYPSLLHLVKDPLCRNLLSLLSTERISIFALDLQVSFLLFESLRCHLKFQMEAFFKKIIEIISTDTTKSVYELKEIHHLALEYLSQMFRIPGLCTELFLNYDCDVYCMNIFEEITKLLSKNVVSSTAYNIHSLSLEALMTVIESIELGTCNQNQAQKDAKNEPEELEDQEDGQKEMKFGRAGHICLELGGMDDASVVSDHVTHDISLYVNGGRTGRHKVNTELPTEAELDNIRNLKKWVTQGTEMFNQKPEKGIEYLQEHGVLTTPLDPHEVAQFLRENPDLDKKMIGEYICKRSSRGEEDDGGPSVLGAFAESFDYRGLRIDQSLRLYLETFRLPGEAPLIFLVMERFAERWHTTNGEPFANTDAAFRLAYAVIMLNMDQHNHNAKKLNVPMTVDEFVKNLRGCNGSGDFEQAMLEEIFHSIKNEEMVMPAERVGPVRDAYLWRVLQRRGNTAGGNYRAASVCNPHNTRLFVVVCPSTLTALSSAFERSTPPTLEEMETNNVRDSGALVAIGGLERVAALVAKLQPPVLTVDTLMLTLCKFTGLLAPQHTNYIAIGVTLGQSTKAQLALRRACAVAARHADCVRDAWRHLLEIVRTLYIGRLLPKCLVDVEDYLAPNGTVSLVRDLARGSEAGLFSSIYSYIALGESGIRAPTPNEKALIETAADCVAKCNLPALLITETKFYQLESLQELSRAMISAGSPPDSDSLQLNPQLEDITIFFMELLGQTLIQNRDRLQTIWESAGAHFDRVLHWSLSTSNAVITRALTCILRACARLMRCAACAPTALKQLTVLLTLRLDTFVHHSNVISSGLYELVKTSAQNVHTTDEWNIVFTLLCAAGAGAWPKDAPSLTTTSKSASSRSGSDDESDRRPTSASSESELSHSPQTQGWILVKNEAASAESNIFSLESVTMRPHQSEALIRCCEALALVVRDVAHVTPYNCKSAVRAVRLFAEATKHPAKRRKSRDMRKARPRSQRHNDSSDEEIDTVDQYHMVSIQLLDLMHTLHSRTAQIFKWWRDEAEGQGAEEYDLWEVAWKPLLQGIAQFCTDRRKKVANSAIAYLQRALLVPGLSAMGGSGWEACFQDVLFPLLEQLPRKADTPTRANTIMCKVFLQHLSALSPRPTFGALWARVIEVQRTLIASPDDPLTEAALESLKNMILVMDSVRIFSNVDGYNDLWYITWEKIGEFLPNLKDELFPNVQDHTRMATGLPSHMQPTIPTSLPTLIPIADNSTSLITNVQGQNQGFVQNSQLMSQSLPQFDQPVLTPNYPQTSQQNSCMTGSNYTQMGQIVPHIGQSHPNPAQIGQNPSQTGQTVPQLVPIPQKLVPESQTAPVSGMVPIRNQLYDQPGLMSSVLLQPLNEMISTPIGISIQSQMPILYPTTRKSPPAVSQETTDNKQTNVGHEMYHLQNVLPRHGTSLIPPVTSLIQPATSLIPPVTSLVPPVTSLIPPATSLIPPVTSLIPPVTSLRPPVTSLIPPVTSLVPPVTSLIPPATSLIPQVTSDIEYNVQETVQDTSQSTNINANESTYFNANQNTIINANQSANNNANVKHFDTNDNEENSMIYEKSQNTILDLEESVSSTDIEQKELYEEYLTNPYHDKGFSVKEATLYDPENQSIVEKFEQKSLSENTTPMHRNKAQFGSSDNVKQESSMFNFSSYFGGTERHGSEVFDTLMSTQEG